MAKFNLISDVPNIVYHVKLMSEYFGIRHYIGVNFIYYPFCEISVFDKLDLYSKCKSEEYEVRHHFFRCILCTPNFTVIVLSLLHATAIELLLSCILNYFFVLRNLGHGIT